MGYIGPKCATCNYMGFDPNTGKCVAFYIREFNECVPC